MTLILLTFLAALCLEAIGTIVSIQGLTLLFGVEPLIISLAIAFDFGKLISVSILYKEWKSLPKTLKTYMFAASAVLMVITSAGAAGYLSAASQKALLPTKSIQVQVDALSQEKQKLEKRKIEIDNQITNLPPDMVKGRTKLIANFKSELDQVNSRIVELDQQVPKLQVELIEKSSHSGPITYIAEATGKTAEQAMGWIIALVIFVFDPLAIALILAGNYLIEKRYSSIASTEILPIASELSQDVEINNELETILEEHQPETEEHSITSPMKLELVDDYDPIEEREEIFIEETNQSEQNEDKIYQYYPVEMIEQAKELSSKAMQLPKSSLENINSDEHVEFQNVYASRTLNDTYK